MMRNKSIIWKLALPIPVIVLTSLMFAWFFIPGMVMENVRNAATETSLQTANQFKVIRGYYTRNVIKKAKANGGLKPAINHKGIANTVPLPATMIHDLSELLSKSDTIMALYSAFPFPGRKDRVLDDFQKSAWEFLNKNPNKSFKREETHNGQTVMRVAIADKMAAQGCVNCHNSHPQTPKADWNLGDVRGVLEIKSDITAAIIAGANLKNKIMLGMLLDGLVIFAIVFSLAHSITKPIESIIETMKKMASGNLDVQISQSKRRDEIGEMANTLRIFQTELLQAKDAETSKQLNQLERDKARVKRENITTEFMSQIGGIVETVSSASTELHVTAQSMSDISDQTSSQAAEASTGSQQTLSNVQSVASATEEMTSTIGEISQQVAQASSASRQAVAEVGNTSEQMSELAQTANKIGEVVELISGIAEQTNLLALNATIESARAGEAGKGFAVVAGEVKQLASQTAKATGEISQQISDIQNATKRASGSMENVAQAIDKVDEISTAIAAAMEEQSAATQEIASSVNQAAVGTQQVTDNISSVSQASQEAGLVSAEVMSAADELSQQSVLLKSEVNNFIEKIRAG